MSSHFAFLEYMVTSEIKCYSIPTESKVKDLNINNDVHSSVHNVSF